MHKEQGTGKSQYMSPAVAGALFALMATLVWSGNFIVSRELVGKLPPSLFALCRWSIAFAVLFPFVARGLYRERASIRRNLLFYVVLAIVGVSYFNTVIYIAAYTTPVLNMSLIATTAPLFTILLARFFLAEPISYMRLVGIVVVMAGVLMLLTKGDVQVLLAMTFQTGDLLVLSGAFSFSLYTFMLRKKPEGVSQMSLLAITFGLGALFLVPMAVWEAYSGRYAPAQIDWFVISRLLFVGIGPSLFSFWCWSKAVQHIGITRASVIYYLIPFFSGIEAILFLGEQVHWVHYVGGSLILGGLLLATQETAKR